MLPTIVGRARGNPPQIPKRSSRQRASRRQGPPCPRLGGGAADGLGEGGRVGGYRPPAHVRFAGPDGELPPALHRAEAPGLLRPAFPEQHAEAEQAIEREGGEAVTEPIDDAPEQRDLEDA